MKFKTSMLLAACSVMMLTACEKKEKAISVGFSQIGAESSWRTANTDSVKSEAQKRNIDLKFADAQQKQENQIKAIRSFIAQDVDAICVSPVVETGWEPVLKEAKKAGIPVILSDRMVTVSEDDLFFTLVSADFVEEGRRAAKWLAEKTGGKCTIVELVGTPGAAPSIDRKKGFEEGIAAYPDMTIIKSQSGDFTRAKGKEVMEAFLKAPDAKQIQALYAHNDDMALGAIQAMEEAGVKPGEEILIVGIDGVRGAFEAIAAGKMNCTVECNPVIGPELFDAVDAALAGKSLPKWVKTEAKVFDRTNAAAELPNRKY